MRSFCWVYSNWWSLGTAALCRNCGYLPTSWGFLSYSARPNLCLLLFSSFSFSLLIIFWPFSCGISQRGLLLLAFSFYCHIQLGARPSSSAQGLRFVTASDFLCVQGFVEVGPRGDIHVRANPPVSVCMYVSCSHAIYRLCTLRRHVCEQQSWVCVRRPQSKLSRDGLGVWQQRCAQCGDCRASKARCVGRYLYSWWACSWEEIGHESRLNKLLGPHGDASLVPISAPFLEIVRLMTLLDALCLWKPTSTGLGIFIWNVVTARSQHACFREMEYSGGVRASACGAAKALWRHSRLVGALGAASGSIGMVSHLLVSLFVHQGNRPGSYSHCLGNHLETAGGMHHLVLLVGGSRRGVR